MRRHAGEDRALASCTRPGCAQEHDQAPGAWRSLRLRGAVERCGALVNPWLADAPSAEGRPESRSCATHRAVRRSEEAPRVPLGGLAFLCRSRHGPDPWIRSLTPSRQTKPGTLMVVLGASLRKRLGATAASPLANRGPAVRGQTAFAHRHADAPRCPRRVRLRHRR